MFDCCVDLGFTAADTLGNARETAEWARSLGYHSLILVTADYHMPRACWSCAPPCPRPRITPYPVATPTWTPRHWLASAPGARRMTLEYSQIPGHPRSRDRSRLTLGRRARAPHDRRPLAPFHRGLLSVVGALAHRRSAAALAGAPALGDGAACASWARVATWAARRRSAACGSRFRGREHLPRAAALIAAKHQCMLDTMRPAGRAGGRRPM